MMTLRGITWNHSRAVPPLSAASQRFEELHAGTEILWQKRSLHAFGHANLSELAENFDLLVIDHPMSGEIEASGALADLLPLLSEEQRNDLEADSVGASYQSYLYHGRLWALPIDAATPGASFRPDLFEQWKMEAPQTWGEVLDLAKRGVVWMPGFPADLFLNFLGMCISRGATVPFSSEQFLDPEIAACCLEDFRRLAASMPEEVYQTNPIALYERMSSGDQIAYCPFAYTYSNYSREGFAPHGLLFANPITLENDVPLRTVLGGTGLAISSRCGDVPLALDYALFVAGALCQRTLYGVCGGQPARKSSWVDATLNHLSGNFFLRTLRSLELAYVRPRYNGYIGMQEKSGVPIREYCLQRIGAKEALSEIDSFYRASRGAIPS